MTMDIYSHLSKDNQKNATSFYEKAIEKLKVPKKVHKIIISVMGNSYIKEF
ncbi:hypothetical protein SPAR51_0007 [Streptococcus pneumoniae GA17719]|nr:hypothetical protein SPAR51_0007 [Streptococcus pneumoniae GA17719]